MPLNKNSAVVLYTLLVATAAAGRTRTIGSKHGNNQPSSLDELDRPRSSDFGYEEEKGPDLWPAYFPKCREREQSPVDINLQKTKSLNVPSLWPPNVVWKPPQVLLTNNGHTVTLTAYSDRVIKYDTLEGGPLRGRYTLHSVHFHWGESDKAGSEHAIDGSYYAMELKMMFVKLSSGFSKQGDVAVLTVFMELNDHDNEALQPVVLALPQVHEVDSVTQPKGIISLEALLPQMHDNYLTYNGSLTQPPCSEVVIYIIFRYPITISSKQIAAFRELKSKHGQLRRNRRPVQPLNGRTVYWSSEPMTRQCARDSVMLNPLYLLCTLVLQCVYYRYIK